MTTTLRAVIAIGAGVYWALAMLSLFANGAQDLRETGHIGIFVCPAIVVWALGI